MLPRLFDLRDVRDDARDNDDRDGESAVARSQGGLMPLTAELDLAWSSIIPTQVCRAPPPARSDSVYVSAITLI
jgi:hypothetical protein